MHTNVIKCLFKNCKTVCLEISIKKKSGLFQYRLLVLIFKYLLGFVFYRVIRVYFVTFWLHGKYFILFDNMKIFIITDLDMCKLI